MALITLNVNGLTTIVKRQGLSNWRKQDTATYNLQEIHFIFKNTNTLKVKEWEKIYCANTTIKELSYTSASGYTNIRPKRI